MSLFSGKGDLTCKIQQIVPWSGLIPEGSADLHGF
jgi:hypothetical protein